MSASTGPLDSLGVRDGWAQVTRLGPLVAELDYASLTARFQRIVASGTAQGT